MPEVYKEENTSKLVKMGWQGPEKRRIPRVDLTCKTAVSYPPVRWVASYSENISYTENISATGARIILEEGLGVFTPVSLELFLDNESSIKCKGRVVWVRERVNPDPGESGKASVIFDTGVEFTEIHEYDRVCIGRLVKLLSVLNRR